jgi:hypothetical protein
MIFDACVAIDQGGCGDIEYDCVVDYGCGGLTWNRACSSNEKYMCRGDNSWSCDDIGSYYCPYWSCVSWATWQRVKHAALLHKETAAPIFTPGTCNPVNFTVLKPSDWTWGHIIGIRIDEKGLDPGTLMHLKLVTVTHKSSSYQVFHSFYEKMKNFPSLQKLKTFLLTG